MRRNISSRARRDGGRPDTDPPPTGWIKVDGKLMPFWLPAGLTPADVRVTDVLRSKRKTP